MTTRLWGNREYIRDASGTTWVKLWVSWYDLQQELGVAPAGRAGLLAAAQRRARRPGVASPTRRQVEAVNNDRLGAILALYHAYPDLVERRRRVRPRRPEQGRRPEAAARRLAGRALGLVHRPT